MQYFGKSWHVRNLLVMVLRLNKSLKLAENIVTLQTRRLRIMSYIGPFPKWILHSSPVVNNARDDSFQLPQMFLLKEVHLKWLPALSYPVTPSVSPSNSITEKSHFSLHAVIG
jgi:hypothetical protein